MVLQASRPAFDAAWSAGLSTTVEPPPPSHSDLVALQYEVGALPALLLLSPNGRHGVTKLAGEQELVAHGLCLGGGVSGGGVGGGGFSGGGFSGGGVSGGGVSGGASTDGGALASLLLGEATSREVASSREKEARRLAGASQMSRLPDALAASSAEWVQQLGWRLVIINVEGALKKPGGLSMPRVAPLRESTNDAFRSSMVPFLRALLVQPRNGDADGAANAELLQTAPHVALVTDLGHQSSERANGSDLLDEKRVRRVLDELLVRLGNELSLSPSAADQLSEQTRVYHNFQPLSMPEPSDEDKWRDPRRAAPEWTHAWCRPRPGQLLQALEDYNVSPSEALMVCITDHDFEAADAAGVASIKLNHLLSGTPAKCVCLPGQRARHGNGKAPPAFAFGGA